MSKVLETIDDELADWLVKQPVFFTGTAPLAADGHVNCSPKGGDCFRVLSPDEVAYVDFTGSGSETIAHVKENGRIVLMFCAFVGKPNIVRLHGTGEVVLPEGAEWDSLYAQFPPNPGARAIVKVRVARISTSCGYAVPYMDYKANRDGLDKWAKSKGEAGLTEYRQEKNAHSIDGLPALTRPEPIRAQTPIISPCVKICKLDAENVCVGCARTLDEIVRWGRMTNAQRQIVMERVAPPCPDAAP